LITFLIDNCDKLLFNDKLNQNVANSYAAGFQLFFKAMDEAVFIEHALPKIDFVIKRNEYFLANVV
jgi:hypothetical protein